MNTEANKFGSSFVTPVKTREENEALEENEAREEKFHTADGYHSGRFLNVELHGGLDLLENFDSLHVNVTEKVETPGGLTKIFEITYVFDKSSVKEFIEEIELSSEAYGLQRQIIFMECELHDCNETSTKIVFDYDRNEEITIQTICVEDVSAHVYNASPFNTDDDKMSDFPPEEDGDGSDGGDYLQQMYADYYPSDDEDEQREDGQEYVPPPVHLLLEEDGDNIPVPAIGADLDAEAPDQAEPEPPAPTSNVSACVSSRSSRSSQSPRNA